MNIKKEIILVFLVTVLFTLNNFCMEGYPLNSRNTEVLVVGTIHQRHATDTNYTYKHLYNILASYNPDIVCVEIRSSDFRKKPYLTEMMMAAIWAFSKDKKVYPIDWWANSNDRQISDSLMNLPEYKLKEQKYEALLAKDSITSSFQKKYGKWEDQRQQGYEFWNGKDYNEYWMKDYEYSMEVFGDSPINLHYRTRNDSMMTLIYSAIHKNPGSRIIVLTGAEHKHYFDNILEHDSDIDLTAFDKILPLPNVEFDPIINSFFDEADDMPYYEKGYPKDINEYYRRKLIPLLHGPDMDFNPDIVPAKNKSIADKVIARWKKEKASSLVPDILDFELGWLDFLKGDYNAAIRYLVPLSKRIEAGKVNDQFIQASAHRNLGLCYDCMGERSNAIACYKLGEKMASKTSYSNMIKYTIKDYIEKPYHPKRD